MPMTLIKREDGSAWLMNGTAPAVLDLPEGAIFDEDQPLQPRDVVDGVMVVDWPVGVHSVKRLTKAP